MLEVSLRLEAGETVALVGESGCGKTTLARAVTGVFGPTSGEIRFAGTTLASTVEKRPPALRREIQYVFQNADASLNPRQRVSTIIGRPLELFFGLRSGAKRRRIDQLLTDVYLDPGCAERFPRQLSGGEQQRVAIARALAAEPRLLICDEILTALDVSVQAGIVELLGELQDRHALSYLFISHDLSVVRSIADRVIVLYCGEVMESGTPEELFGSPKHPYTRLLISSIPDVARRGTNLPTGQAAPDGVDDLHMEIIGDGCPFTSRCPESLPGICDSIAPRTTMVSDTHLARCHAVEEGRLARDPRSS